MTADNSAHFDLCSKPLIACVVCNNSFTPKRKTSTCCSQQCRDKNKYQAKKILNTKQCISCDKDFTAKQGQSKYCSSICRVKHIADKSKEQRRLFTLIAEAHIRVSFCVVCNAFCEAPYQGKLKRYCSPNCENKNERTTPRYRAKRARRDALKRKAAVVNSIDPVHILTRDNWTCYLCGVNTPSKLRGTYEANAPEVDHVVPLSKGGMHVESNLRCACRRCNSEKGDKVLT